MRKMLDPHTTLLLLVLIATYTPQIACRSYHTNDDEYYEHSPRSKYATSTSASSTEANDIEDRHDNDHHQPAYRYEYSVNSPQTGDYKSQHEERIGDTVHGSYSLIEPDGSKRIVDYTADAEHGFRAVVRHELPTGHHLHAPEILHNDLDTPLRPRYPILTRTLRVPTAPSVTSVTHVQHSSTAPTTPSYFSSSTPRLEVAVRPRKSFFDLPQHLLHQMPYFRTHLPASTPTPTPKYYVNPLARLNGWSFPY